jgi:hypothetical protein
MPARKTTSGVLSLSPTSIASSFLSVITLRPEQAKDLIRQLDFPPVLEKD